MLSGEEDEDEEEAEEKAGKGSENTSGFIGLSSTEWLPA